MKALNWKTQFSKRPGFYWFKREASDFLYCAHVVRFYKEIGKDRKFTGYRVYLTGLYEVYVTDKNGTGSPKGKWLKINNIPKNK